jgi:hypothetical protein
MERRCVRVRGVACKTYWSQYGMHNWIRWCRVLEGYVLCLDMSCRTDAATLSRRLDKEGPRFAQVSVCILPRSRMAEQRMFLLSLVLAIVVRFRLLLHE